MRQCDVYMQDSRFLKPPQGLYAMYSTTEMKTPQGAVLRAIVPSIVPSIDGTIDGTIAVVWLYATNYSYRARH